MKLSTFRRSNKKGFTLVELMIVMAIVGILASVCIPLYMSYIQRSRVRVYVYPGLHIIETNIALHYASTSTMPPASDLPKMWEEADTKYFHANIVGNDLVITIDSPPGPDSKLSRMHDMTMYLTPDTDNLNIRTWTVRGTLAEFLGINTEFN